MIESSRALNRGRVKIVAGLLEELFQGLGKQKQIENFEAYAGAREMFAVLDSELPAEDVKAQAAKANTPSLAS